ncbi:MAG TPA: mycofactocin-associated electron transfer flavoprotein beta subunit [Asanoa sp.]|jgi:electron transfer flavoprotein beta subunit|nr:mycofactocin-associated electron transfer flavoprotein beta subunit [Asanoa sp.]
MAELVVACLRFGDLRPSVDPLTGSVSRDPRGFELSAADAAALEHALRLGDAWSAPVLAVTAAAASADPLLRTALALGASVLRVPWAPSSYVADLALDERALALAVASAIRGVGTPSVVVCGDVSSDRGTGAFPAYLAHALDAAQALGLVALSVSGNALAGERRLDGGRRERLRIPRPAVCSVEAAGVRLRRASLPATLAASSASVPVATVVPSASAGAVEVTGVGPFRPRTRVVPAPAGDSSRDRLMHLTGVLVAHDPPQIVTPASAASAADALLDYLRRRGYAAPA